MTEKATFRPDLEGLRAVAVVLVLLYHARIPGLSGGYIGVDVFFVLSGFLITGLIIRELQGTGRVSLTAFYARRARRLLPAAALVLAVTMAVSVVVLPPLQVPDVAGDTIAAALYASNIRFAVQATDYLGSTLPPSPVLHYWSLGVEEQFYLFWPALLAVTAGALFARGRPAQGLRRLGVVLCVVLGLSFATSLWLSDAAQAWAFFSLPTRAWELALGAILSLPLAARLVPPRASPWLAWTGLVMVVASALVYNEETRFPGTSAVLPTVGSALVIAAGLTVASRPAGARRFLDPGAILSLAPMRFLGRISYSLYLWHWPVLVLPAAAVGHALPGAVRVGLAVVAIALAAATQRWVEDPIRHGRVVGLDSRRSLALAGVLSAVLVLGSASLGSTVVRIQAAGPVIGGDIADVPLPPDPTVGPSSTGAAGSSPSPAPSSSAPSATLPPLASDPVPADLVPSLAAARDDLPPIYADGCHLGVVTTKPGTCAFGDTSSPTTVVLFGDSHAAQWFPALEQLATDNHWRLVSLTKSACTAADVTVWNGITKRDYVECDEWREQALLRIAAERPALVVVSDSRGYRLMVDGAWVPVASARGQWDAAMRRTLTRIAGLASAVAVIGDTPRATDDPPACLSDSLDDASACALAFDKAVNPAWTQGEASVATEAGATFIDPTAWVCRTDPCPAVIGRLLIFRDQHHLTATYARALAERLLPRLPLGGLTGAPIRAVQHAP